MTTDIESLEGLERLLENRVQEEMQVCLDHRANRSAGDQDIQDNRRQVQPAVIRYR